MSPSCVYVYTLLSLVNEIFLVDGTLITYTLSTWRRTMPRIRKSKYAVS